MGRMTDYRRAKARGGMYFFTVVTCKRSQFLTDSFARSCLRSAIEETRERYPFQVIATCLLPDHIHCMWELPAGDNNYSTRWSLIKASFTRRYLAERSSEVTQSLSRQKKRERGVWQRRFWEHRIRDEADLQRHVDYIHYNPVKHHLVEEVENWPWSTYHRYVKEGKYLNRHWDQIQDQVTNLLVGE